MSRTATMTAAQTAPLKPGFSWRTLGEKMLNGTGMLYLCEVLGDEDEYVENPIAAGFEALEQGDAVRALELLRAGLKAEAHHVAARRAVAKLLVGQNKAAEAVEHLELALRVEPRNAALHLQHGEAAQAAGDRLKAEAAYQRAIALDSKLTDAYVRLGLLCFEAKRWNDAQKAFDYAIYNDRQAAIARFYLAQVCMATGDLKRALVQLHLVLTINPGYAPAHLCLAAIFEVMKDHRQAIAELEKVIALDFVNADVMLRTAKAYKALGEHEQALTAYLSAVSHDARCFEAVREAARMLEAKGQLVRARELFNILLSDAKNRVEAAVSIGRIDQALGQINNAMAA